MLRPAVKENERRSVVPGSRDVNAEARGLDQLVLDPRNRRWLPIRHGPAAYARKRTASLRHMVVAIDGPAGAGKSTVARLLAERLGWRYLDSGAMYRAAALATIQDGGDPAARAAAADIDVGERVVLDGRDVTDAIRAPEVTEASSRIAKDPDVRQALVKKQRDLLGDGDWVAEGRDIGTVVAPDAALKIFLTASPEQRAQRRAVELGADWRVVLRDQTLRDAQDAERAHSPLRPAIDAIELDTTDRPVEDVVAQVAGLVRDVR
jgi:CMP/dCMP kinase